MQKVHVVMSESIWFHYCYVYMYMYTYSLWLQIAYAFRYMYGLFTSYTSSVARDTNMRGNT